METTTPEIKEPFKAELEHLIEQGGYILSKCIKTTGIANNKRYLEYSSDDVQYENLKKWREDILDVLIKNEANATYEKVQRIPITSNHVRNNVLPDNIDKIRTILIEVKNNILV